MDYFGRFVLVMENLIRALARFLAQVCCVVEDLLPRGIVSDFMGDENVGHDFIFYGSSTTELASAWIALVRGAQASRLLPSASRRGRFGWFGRDAQTDTRDACAPRTTDFDFCNASGLAAGMFTPNALRSEEHTT